MREFIKRRKKFFCIAGCLVLIFAGWAVVRNTTMEKRLQREYGLHDVRLVHYNIGNTIGISLMLNDSDLERYYLTEEGEKFLDRVISEVIVKINEDETFSRRIIDLARENAYENFSIQINVRQRDEFMISSKRKEIGWYSSAVYPIEEWFTDANKQKQQWMKYLSLDDHKWKEYDAVSLPRIQEMMKGQKYN